MSFTGNTDNDKRNDAQVSLYKSIGNDSTRPRSIELAIRTEQALYERVGHRLDKKNYAAHIEAMQKKLKDPQRGFELNRRLLTGELAPEKWVTQFAKDKLALRVKQSTTSSDAKQAAAESAAHVSTAAATSAAAAAASASASASASSSSTSTGATSSNDTDATAMDVDSTNASVPHTAPRKLNDPTEIPKVETKTDSSYYHFRSTDPELAKQYVPKKLDAPTPAAANPDSKSGPSAWNTGGTWEDRDMSKWARGHLRELLDAFDATGAIGTIEDGSVTVKPWAVGGSATVVYIRKKKKCGFELKCDSSVSGEHKGVAVSGKITLEIDDVAFSDGDYELFIKMDKSTDASLVIKRALRKLNKPLREVVKQFVKDFRSGQ
jgi:activator of HSP90 ATPase